jgi:integrase
MEVWRKQTIRFVFKGRQVRKGTPGAIRLPEHSKRFYGTLRLANGKRKQVPLSDERGTSRKLLRRLQTEQDERRASGVQHEYATQQPVSELIDAYVDHLRAKANCDAYVDGAKRRIRRLLSATKVSSLSDLDGGRILNMLAIWRRQISVNTSNDYLIAAKAFSRWAWQERKMPDDPLAGLRRLNSETDRRRVRRALTPAELESLVSVTHQSRRTYRGNDWQFTGTDRSMLYLTAAFTGLRASELASLTKASFDFEAMTWTLAAASAKNRKATTLPLSPALAARLQKWFATLNRDALFPGSWAKYKRAGRILKRDLAKAGIAYQDDAGRCVDFHAPRYTFVSSLAKAGVHPAKAQRLARHSTINLTMNVYTSLDVDDLRDAVSSLQFKSAS